MQAFFKCCELLSSLVRSDSHITPSNFPITLATIRRFTEIAASQGSLQYDETIPKNPKTGSNKKDKNSQKQSKAAKKSDATKQTNSLTYATSSLRLLDLLDALYTRVPHVYDEQALLDYTDWLLMEMVLQRVDYTPLKVTGKGQRESSLGDCYGRWY